MIKTSRKQKLQIIIYLLVIVALFSIIPLNYYFGSRRSGTLVGTEQTSEQESSISNGSVLSAETFHDTEQSKRTTTAEFWRQTVLPVIVGVILVLVGIELIFLIKTPTSEKPHLKNT